jgi:NADH-quinone oxidoreductase subunit C
MELAELIAAAVPAAQPTESECPSGPVVVIRPEAVADVLRFLRDDPGQAYNALSDITAVDHRDNEGCFYVVYILLSHTRDARLILKARIDHAPGDDATPTLPSASALWRSANWAEREVWDMFGIKFDGHPELRRILMYEEFVGHPLRKDYPVDKRQPLVEERDPIADPWPSRDGR